MSVLEQTPSDPKALFRRCQALEALGRVQEAYRDARHLHNEQPDNREVQPLLSRLYAAVQKQVRRLTGAGAARRWSSDVRKVTRVVSVSCRSVTGLAPPPD